jgi:hypothetical protein
MSEERRAHVKRGDAMTAKERKEVFSKAELKQYNNWRGQANNFLGRLGNAIARLDGVTPIHKQESEKGARDTTESTALGITREHAHPNCRDGNDGLR